MLLHMQLSVCVSSIRNGREEINDTPRSGALTLVMDECHMEQMKSVLECTRSTSCTVVATDVSISPASVYCNFPTSFGKQKVCVEWILNTFTDDQQATFVVFAATHLQLWRNDGNTFLNHILTVAESWLHSFDCQLKQWNAEWCAQMSLRMKIVWGSQGALKVVRILFFSQNGLVLDHPCQLV